MERMEMVEKLREKAQITMEEAKDLLENTNWDMLDAMIELEKQGKIKEGAKASTEKKAEQYEIVAPTASGKDKEERRANRGKFRRFIKKAFRVSLDMKFNVYKNGNQVMSVPLLVPVLCGLGSAGTTFLVMAGGLFFGFRYSLEGNDFGTDTINRTMDQAGNVADDLVKELKNRKEKEEVIIEENVSDNSEMAEAEVVEEVLEQE